MNHHSNSFMHTGYRQHGDGPYDDNRIDVSSISLVPGSSSGVAGRMGSFGGFGQDIAYEIPLALARVMSQPPMQTLAHNPDTPREAPPRRLAARQSLTTVDPILMGNEQNKGLEKLRREIYNPGVERVSLYYRDNNSRAKSRENNNEDGKRCVVCLEDFEPREMVTLTPCHHMFHEYCIVPWIKSHGQCPVCRFVINDESKDREGTRTHNNSELGIDPFARELVYFIRTMEARV